MLIFFGRAGRSKMDGKLTLIVRSVFLGVLWPPS